MIKIAVIDDEIKFRDTVKMFLDKYSKEKGTVFDIKFFKNGMDFLLKGRVFFDLLLIDVDMPEMDGFRLSAKVREYDTKCVIVFITNLQNYAIRGYEVNAFDYVLKPLNYGIFSRKMDKILAAVYRNAKKFIVLNMDYDKIKLNISDITYVESNGHKILYHTLNGIIEQWASIKNAYAQLKDDGFEMCNSCYIVNLQYVEDIKQGAIVVHGEVLLVSRSRYKSFLDALTKFSI